MVLLLLLAPLPGVLFRGEPVVGYLEFPPLTRYVVHAPFSWLFFSAITLFVVGACFPFMYRFFTYTTGPSKSLQAFPFPWWGWTGLLVLLLTWFLAWNRFSFFAPFQRFTFFPFWLGYILVVNGLTFRRKGTCLLRSQPGRFIFLFLLSALFWWYFEYVNRFVQNWYYHSGGDISAAEYIIHASVCFSTVLPAVLSTHQFLGTLSGLKIPFADWYRVNVRPGRKAGWFILACSFVSMAALVVFPDYLFPLVWIAPLFIIVGIQLVTGRPTIFFGLRRGDWQDIVLPAIAALICGFFWEMWNWKSLAHWQYSIPFVHRFQLFHMPILGYAGYLPFGLECLAVARLTDMDEKIAG